MEIKVSIIIPAYNYAVYIGDTLRSLQEQTLFNWECLVVDDGSTDSTREVVNEFAKEDGRIIYLHQQNKGQPAARNAGMALARGKYIQFLDADDMLQSQKLEIQSGWLDNHPETDVVYGKVYYFSNSSKSTLFLNRWDDPMSEWMPGVSGRGFVMVRAFAEKNIFELGCAMVRRSRLAMIGVFNTDLQGLEDYDFMFRAALNGFGFSFVDKPETAVMMRNHPGSFSKGRLGMYKKEASLRKLMMAKPGIGDNADIREINKANYKRCVRKVADLIIDRKIKRDPQPLRTEIRWVWNHASFRQKTYFLPRLLKAAML